MKGLLSANLIGFLALCRMASGQINDSFIVETHVVRSALSATPLWVAFRLDTTVGDVWRLVGSEMVKVPVAGSPLAGESHQALLKMAETSRVQERLIEKTKAIVIPEMDFRRANLEDVLSFLREGAKEHDPDRQGISILMHMPQASRQNDPADPFAVPLGGGTPDFPLITFSARRVSLYQALRIVTQISNLRLRFVQGEIWIVPVGGEDHMIHREFRLHSTLLHKLIRSGHEPAGGEPSDSETEWRAFFADLGVEWPVDSSISYTPVLGTLKVVNTPENITRLEDVLARIDVFPPRLGRFRFTRSPDQAGVLWLLDADSGGMWRYEVIEVDEQACILSDAFVRMDQEGPP